MTPEEVRDVALTSLALAVSSAALIAIDLAGGKKQDVPVMNLVWPLTALYAGPFAVLAYFWFGSASRASRNMVRSRPSLFPKPPMWQRTVLGAAQCGAGCALGGLLLGGELFHLDNAPVPATATLAFYVLGSVVAFVLGIGFQYFTLQPKRAQSTRTRLWAAFKGDALSVLAFQVGACTWMAVCSKLIFDSSLEANDLVFWFMMQLSMIIGLIISYPMNWMLVKQGIKKAT